jgi:MFS transporter, PHS family, inorganic phosphate transporter
VATIIILSCFKKSIKDEGHYNQLDAVWRIQMGIALVPAFATLIPRLRMPEGKKYVESQELNTPASYTSTTHHGVSNTESDSPEVPNTPVVANDPHSAHPQKIAQKVTNLPTVPLKIVDLENLAQPESRNAKLNAFFVYFSEWRHLKTLIGTASCWFLLDVAFYGTNLNQSVLLADIGYSTGKTHFDVLLRNAIGNLIIAISGYVPGYFFTIFLVEKMGRKWIQIQGFLICALMFAILAGGYAKLNTGGKFACFAIAQVCSHLPRHCLHFTLSRSLLTHISSSSTSAPMQQHSSSPPKSTPPACVASHTVSPPQSASSAPSWPRSSLTGSLTQKSLALLMCFGSSLLAIFLALPVRGF